MKKFWENANHFVRIIGGVGALAAFVLAGLFIAVTLFAVWGYKETPDWKAIIAILTAGGLAVYGAVSLGLRAWQESKHTICASRGCDKPVASLGDLLCSDCLAEKEQGESATTAETPQDESAPTTPPESAVAATTDEMPTDDGKVSAASAKESAPKCLTSACDKPRPQRENGKYWWWCIKCWKERRRKAEEDGVQPRCWTDGCNNRVSYTFHPWCSECHAEHPVVTPNGERFRSHPEKRIAAFLRENNVPYEYEKPLPGTAWTCDFFLPPSGGRRAVYIEYFGFIHKPEYCKRMEEKEAYYAAQEFELLALRPEEGAEPVDLDKRLALGLRNLGYPI